MLTVRVYKPTKLLNVSEHKLRRNRFTFRATVSKISVGLVVTVVENNADGVLRRHW